MTHYTILPMDAVLEGLEEMDKTQTLEISVDGVTMQVQPLNQRQASIVRLISCNPQDFLNPRFAPGRLIEFEPVTKGEA
ncbi:YlzJ-like family protein [Paenibacillus filicis]|uniref:YlzJ-like family protein n=1 Tax=Paenibacillus gyeongsangnamensis TaxID=3388067 RepID=A0ABT4Q665_9BACL|nr:YlzJ-like family protein [Paenibacillus filicis]MCZ8512308.1 YlzJ-like family protein [Paenibacillus filicis]